MIRQPEERKGTDDEQDQTAALSSPLELDAPKAADDGGVTRVDEGERQQAAHDGLEQVLKDLVTHAAPVVRNAEVHGDVAVQEEPPITVEEGKICCMSMKNDKG